VLLNQFGLDIEVISKAIGRADGMANMKVSSSSMGHSVRHVGSELAGTHIEVSITALDNLLTDRPRLQRRRMILKVDAEGYEPEVFAGAERLFSSGAISAVVWEKVACYDQPVQSRLNKASIDFLSSFGFEHFRMEDEDLGGQLLPLEGKDVLRNVYSLSRHFARSERY
jgi:FkbM family methyltransferase